MEPSEVSRLLQQDLESIRLKVAKGIPLTETEHRRLKAGAAAAVENKGETPIAGVADDAGPKWAESQIDLAKALGVDRKTIQRHLKSGDSPGKTPDGRYNLHEWRAWLRYRGKKGGKVHDKNALECRRLLIDIAERDFDFAVKQKQYTANSDVEKWWGEFAFGIKQTLLAWPGQLAPDLADKTAPMAEKILTKKVKELLSDLADGPWQWKGQKSTA